MNFLFFVFLLSLVVFLLGTIRALKMSNISVKLIEKYKNKKNDPKLIDEIFGFINADFLLNHILKKHQATKSDIQTLHSKLMIYGDFRKYNRYIPITSFFNVSALNYLLKHKTDDAQSIAKKMMDYFHF